MLRLRQKKAGWFLIVAISLVTSRCREDVDPILPGLNESIRYLDITQNSSSYSVTANGKNTIHFSITPLDENKKPLPFSITSAKISVNGTSTLEYPYNFTTTIVGRNYFRIVDVAAENVILPTLGIVAYGPKIYESVTLPVIFHYVTTSPISEEQKMSIHQTLVDNINAVNKAYSNQMDSNNPDAANSFIQFSMAEQDPDEQPLQFAGLNIVTTGLTSFGSIDDKTIMDDFIWDGHFWPPKKYINVWIAPVNEDYSWGYYPPLEPSEDDYPERVYGVVLKQDHISSAYVITHELGHVLNLYHVFDESCNDPDLCEDTWSYFRKWDDQSTTFNAERTDCDGLKFIADNIMDYSPTLGITFSAQQVMRMRAVLDWCPFIPTPKNINGGRIKGGRQSTRKMRREPEYDFRVY